MANGQFFVSGRLVPVKIVDDSPSPACALISTDLSKGSALIEL